MYEAERKVDAEEIDCHEVNNEINVTPGDLDIAPQIQKEETPPACCGKCPDQFRLTSISTLTRAL